LYYNFAGGKVSRKILNGFYGKQLLHEKNKNLNFKKIQVSIFGANKIRKVIADLKMRVRILFINFAYTFLSQRSKK